MPDYADAISAIESGGRYDLLGPVTRTGDRAYGRYQVMGNNVGPWTQRYLGQPMTPQQFLASPEAQDAVFQGEFGRLASRHGPEGAARAWFAGEGGMNDPTRKDQLGTTVENYGRRFMAGLGQPQGAPPGLLANSAPEASPEAPAGLLGGQFSGGMNRGLAQQGLGLMGGPQMAPPPMLAPPPRRKVDLSALLALAGGTYGQ